MVQEFRCRAVLRSLMSSLISKINNGLPSRVVLRHVSACDRNPPAVRVTVHQFAFPVSLCLKYSVQFIARRRKFRGEQFMAASAQRLISGPAIHSFRAVIPISDGSVKSVSVDGIRAKVKQRRLPREVGLGLAGET